MTTPKVKHPAPYSPAIIDAMATLINREALRRDLPVHELMVLDPMAGTGRIHQLPARTFGIELEPEWAAWHPDTKVGNACSLPFDDDRFHAIGVSPAYGNRFADHHNPKDTSTRRSYKFDLGRDPSPGSSGVLHFGPAYRRLHQRAWEEATRVLMPGGLFMLNVSNFVRDFQVVQVAEWHMAVLFRLGYLLESAETVSTRRLRHGANREARVDGELVVALRKPL
ncbi:MAG: hypothetical protein KGH75_00240 [Rhodospirillales bacterium]|nr:hypothetical protein [Rhodospirillales bacterium]